MFRLPEKIRFVDGEPVDQFLKLGLIADQSSVVASSLDRQRLGALGQRLQQHPLAVVFDRQAAARLDQCLDRAGIGAHCQPSALASCIIVGAMASTGSIFCTLPASMATRFIP